MKTIGQIITAISIFSLIVWLSSCSSLESDNPRSRIRAVKKLKDQALLAKIALEDDNIDVSEAAIKNLTDQALLAKVALADINYSVRLAAIPKLTDQDVLIKLALLDENRYVNCVSTARVNDADVLRIIASRSTRDVHSKIARMKLTLLNTVISRKLGKLDLEVTFKEDSRFYVEEIIGSSMVGWAAQSYTVLGENYYLRIRTEKDRKLIAYDDFLVNFPSSMSPAEGPELKKAKGDIVHMITRILSQGQFSDSEMLELALSDVWELGLIAILRLKSDLDVAKVALEAKDHRIRSMAVLKLKNQSVLAKIASEDENNIVKVEAMKKLTDPSLLKKIYQINIKAKVIGISKKYKLVGISAGKTDGVKSGYRFHVIRKEKYICDIVITEVESNEAIGVWELNTDYPQLGDFVKGCNFQLDLVKEGDSWSVKRICFCSFREIEL